MFRLVHRPLGIAVAALAFLFALSAFGLYYYILSSSLTTERLLMCVLGVILFAVLLNVYGWPVTWEVGAEAVRKVVGGTPVADFPLHEIASVSVFVIGTNEVFQSIDIRSHRGNLLLRIERDHLAIQDVREFYESLAHYLRPYSISMRNPFGWGPRPPEVPERRLPTGRMNWRNLFENLAGNAVHGIGLGLAVAGAEKGWTWVFVAGVALFVTGGPPIRPLDSQTARTRPMVVGLVRDSSVLM